MTIRFSQMTGRTMALCLLPAFIVTGNCLAAEDAPQAIPVYEGYELVWHDEFSVDGPPDPTRWTYETGFVRNGELQWFQRDNAVISDGTLRLVARRERVRNPNHDLASNDWRIRRRAARYTSASVTTRDVAAWQYGRFEIRARMPVEEGLWPVIWTVGTAADWPAGGEVDIAEAYRGYLLANGAWASRRDGEAKWDAKRVRISRLGGDDWAEEFHTWRMDWDENRITLSVDDRVLNRINVKRARNPRDVLPRYPFRHPHQLFLSLAIGGTNGGDPEKTSFPASLEIDYVRIYQRTASNE